MSRTLAQVRALTAKQTGLLYESLTSDTGGSTTVLRDATLKKYPDDKLNGHHILLTSGSPSETELLATDFDGATNGDITFKPTLGAAPDSLTYEILPFSGTQFLVAIQESVYELYDVGLLSKETWIHMIAGSPLYNADWSYWTSSTAIDGWALNGSGTLARERASGNIALSETAARLSTTADYLYLTARYKRFLDDLKGYALTLYCPVLTSTASIARINLYDGSNNYSPFHGGTGAWELLHVAVSVATSATDLEPRLYNDGTANVYFGTPFIIGGPQTTLYPFTIALMPDGPSSVRLGWLGIEENKLASGRGIFNLREMGKQRDLADFGFFKHHDENTTTEIGLLDLSTSRRLPPSGMHMLVKGQGPLTIPATTTGTEALEITETESLLIATLAARRLLERAMTTAPLNLQRQYSQRATLLTRNFEAIAQGAGRRRDVASLPMRW